MRPNKTATVAVVLAGVALAASAWNTVDPYAVRQDAAAVQSQARSLGELVTDVCAKGGAAAAELGPNGACVKAAEVQGQPPVAQAAPLDPAELRAAARTAVSEYCAARNGCRGTDGSTPNFDAIVTAVVARIPAPQNGTNGENGQAGQNASADQVAAAVAAYCGQDSQPCRGPAGQDGSDGTDGASGAPGPTCPEGYELRDAVITAKDGTTYSGKACVDPASSEPPSSNPILPIPPN